jgi:hypothetical protein
MASQAGTTLSRIPWRPLGWGAAVALLLLPLIAMQFTKEVVWTLADFMVFGVMLLMVVIPLELVARVSSSWSYRGAAALALFGMFLTIWANLAVGIVGSENNPANQLFFAALLVGIAGSVVARLRPRGMALAMVATAASLGLAFLIASSGATDEPWVKHSVEAVGTSIFALFFLGSAALFRRSARHQLSEDRPA